MADCPFCKEHEETSYRIIEKSDLCFCLVNAEPLNKFHVMVLPTRHVKDVEELSKEESFAINQMLARIREKIFKKSGDYPLIFLNTGILRTQDHLHYHLLALPDGFGGIRGMYAKMFDTDERKRQSHEFLESVKKSLVE